MNALLNPVPRPTFIDYLAPDNSEIRLLKEGQSVGLCECSLPPGAVTIPVRHRVVEEAWYVISGTGSLWRRLDDGHEADIPLVPGDSVVIPHRAAFQFAAGEQEPLVMILATAPVWGQELDAGGPDALTEYGTGHRRPWKPVKPAPEYRIQGKWWQFAQQPDKTLQIALMEIARTGDRKYAIKGQSYTEGWEPGAEFGSDFACLVSNELIMRYAWTGKLNDQLYSGMGEILFQDGEEINEAIGYYDMRLGPGVADIARINLAYSRVRAEEAQNLNSLLATKQTFDETLSKHFARSLSAA